MFPGLGLPLVSGPPNNSADPDIVELGIWAKIPSGLGWSNGEFVASVDLQLLNPTLQAITLRVDHLVSDGVDIAPFVVIDHVDYVASSDVSGTFQMNMLCGGEIVEARRVSISQSGSEFDMVTDDCGVVVTSDGPQPVASCSSDPDPIVGNVGPIDFISGWVLQNARIQIDYTSAVSTTTPLCGVVGIDRVESDRKTAFGLIVPGPALLATVPEVVFLTGVDYFSGPTLCENSPAPGVGCGYWIYSNELPAGLGLEVEPAPGVRLVFDDVSAPGFAQAYPVSPTFSTPLGFTNLPSATFYDITTTATWTGNVTVCLGYDDFNQDGIVDGTTINELLLAISKNGLFTLMPAINTVANEVCVTDSSLSEFVVPEPGFASLVGAGSGLLCLLGRRRRRRSEDLSRSC